MKKTLCCLLAAFGLLLSGCGGQTESGDVVLLTTTRPMYELTEKIVGTLQGVRVEALVTEQVSCLHDYSITTAQMKSLERADTVILSGAGLEDFLDSALEGKSNVIDSSAGIETLEDDPHIWLDPRRYARQGENIAAALAEQYPQWAEEFQKNAENYKQELLERYEKEWYPAAQTLTQRELVTFHDGFSYFAEAYDLGILAAMEEEEGAEPSAAELKEVISLIESHGIPTIYTEKNGLTNAAEIVAQETGAQMGVLDLGMSEGDYETVMDSNLAALKAGEQ